MDALSQHPWLVQTGFGDWLKRTIGDSMQSVAAMLASELPPNWIVTLSVVGFDYHSHTQLTVSGSSTISILGDAHDGPLVCDLSAAQHRNLLAALTDCSSSNVCDIENQVLDGFLCVVAVVNGTDNWCAFSEFNGSGLDAHQSSAAGPRIATLIESFHRDFRSVSSDP